MRLHIGIAICFAAILCLVQLPTAANAAMAFSPFTEDSNYLEITVPLPDVSSSDGLEFDFTVATSGFTAKQGIEIKLVEKYRSSADSPWDLQDFLHKAHFDRKKTTTDFKFDLSFLKIKSSEKAGGYERSIHFRFDIEEWEDDEPEVSLRLKMRSTKTNRSFSVPTESAVAFSPLSKEMKLSMSKSGSGSGKDKHQQAFEIKFRKTRAPISAANGQLVLYSYVDEYNFDSLDSSVVYSTCKLGAYTLPATLLSPADASPYLSIDLDMNSNVIPVGSTVELTCPDFIVHRNSTKAHLTEYWVAYTTADNLHSTQYEGGANRLDNASLIIIIVLVVAFIIFLFALWICCKCCKCLCYR